MTLDPLTYFLTLLALASIGLWIAFLVRAGYHGSSILNLKDQATALGEKLPTLSVIIAARNEANTLEESLASLASADYPQLEVILVDDRSTDATGSIIDRVAHENPRFKAVHVQSLPDGWLGKVHALKVGEAIATGDWLLFTDADLVFEAGVLAKAVTYAEERRLDHLALLPETHEDSGGMLLSLFVFAFGGMFVSRIKAADVSKESSEAFAGVGAFNLVRRAKFNQTPGFEWLRLEVLDDVGLGLMMKRAGGRAAILNGAGLLHLEWYHSLSLAIKGLEKNAFAGLARFSVLRALWLAWTILFVLLTPFICAIVLKSWIILFIALSGYSLLPFFVSLVRAKETNIRPIVAALLPVGYLFIVYALLRSTVIAVKNGGIRWRDTYYSSEDLRKGQRVKL
jgi:glycosyltransferase involved in cell wall biosynthesis